MNDPADHRILYPAFAMFALVAVVFGRMAFLRFGAVRRGEMDPRFYRTYQDGEEPDHMRVVTRNFINLFEVPVLFYVALVLAHLTQQVSAWTLGCAWAYVASRYLHSWVHLTSNDVLTRFRVYLASFVVLTALWASLLAGLLAGT